MLPDRDEAGWVSRLTVKSLYAPSEVANKIMTLTLPDKRQFIVIFDRLSGVSVQVQEVLLFACPVDNNQYLLTLRLLIIESA